MDREGLKKWGFFTYGKVIPGLMVHGKPAPYPVLNERAIRAGAGIVFAAGFFSFFQALYLGNFFFLKLLVPFLFFDFLMKVVVGIRFSPMSQLANWIVRAQQSEWVGAVQKRFAWSIGLVLSGTMMLLLYVFEVRGWPNLTICSICLTFMFMESAFGICVGCKIYNWLMKKGIIETPEYKPACPGNVCSI
jgi:Domain of unknown function (DUF4395)